MSAADFPSIRIINAGAGSGKTHRLTEELARSLDPSDGEAVRPEARDSGREAREEILGILAIPSGRSLNSRVHVALNDRGYAHCGRISVMDTAQNAILDVASVGDMNLKGVAVHADGKRLYVPTESGTVVVVGTASLTTVTKGSFGGSTSH